MLLSDENKITSLSSGGKSIYVTGEIENVTTVFLIDTGAMSTVISHKIASKLPIEIKDELKCKSTIMNTADGKDILAQGPVMMKITVGGQTVTT
jgi:predicted aspartyl protease